MAVEHDARMNKNKPPFGEVWARLVACAGRPFLTDGGHEFNYQVDGDMVRLSHRGAVISKTVLMQAWALMPCAVVDLPKVYIPRGYVWALLHDTRVGGTSLLPDLPPGLVRAAKTPEKAVQPPPRRKRRSRRAVARQRARAAGKRA